MRALEVTGTVDEQGRLHLEQTLSNVSPGPVRVIVLFPEETDISEQEWLRAASNNPTFDFLNDPEEDIYTVAEGEPFSVER